MANVSISSDRVKLIVDLPIADKLTGLEQTAVVQQGNTKQTDISNIGDYTKTLDYATWVYNASSYLTTKNLTVSGNSTTSLVNFTQLGTGNVLTISDHTNDNSPTIIDQFGNLGIGLSALPVNNTNKVYIIGNTTSVGNISSTGTFTNVGDIYSRSGNIYAQGLGMGTTSIANSADAVIQSNNQYGGLFISQINLSGFALKVSDQAGNDPSPFVIDNAGNVGIGTTNLGQNKLTLIGDMSAVGKITNTGDIYSSLGNIYAQGLGVGTTSISNSADAVIQSNNPNGGLFVSQNNTSGFAFKVSDQVGDDPSPFIIDNAGNVAIGSTNTSNAKLTLIGDLSAVGKITSVGDIYSGSGNIYVQGLGMGTTSISNSADAVIQSNNPNGGLFVSQINANGYAFKVSDQGGNDPSPFIIDNAGNVAIGTTNTSNAKVTIIGTISTVNDVSTGTSNQWNSVYSTFQGQSANNTSVYSTFQGQSGNNTSVYSTFQGQSANNTNVYTNFSTQSANNLSVYSTFNGQSANNTNVYSNFSTQSANNLSVYSTFNGQSANNTNVYSNFSTQSANNLSVYSTFNGQSANNTSVYSTFQGQSANNTSVYSTFQGQSANNTSVYSTFQGQSANNTSVYSTFQGQSANNTSVYSTFQGQSANNTSVYSTFRGQSANNTSVYSYVNQNSAYYVLTQTNLAQNYPNIAPQQIWGDLTIHGVISSSGGISNQTINVGTTSAFNVINNNGSVYAVNVVQASGSKGIANFYDGNYVLYVGKSTNADGSRYSGGYVGVGTNTPNATLTVTGTISANNTIYDVVGNSNQWNSVYSTFQGQSGNNTSVYTTFQGLSGNNTYVYSTFQGQSGNNTSVYSTFQSQSGNNTSVYSTFQSQSGNNTSVYTTFQSQSGNNTSVYSTFQSQSGNNTSVYSTFQGQSGNNTSVYSTFQGQSGNNTSVYTTFQGQSGNNTSVYSTFQGQSGNNTSVYSYVYQNSAGFGTTKKAVSTIGNGSATNFVFNHNLNTNDVITQVYNISTGSVGTPSITISSANSVTINFGFVPTANSYRVVVIG